MAQLEVQKMKQGMSYSRKEKTIIMNVFKYFCLQFPDKCVTEIVRRTSKATGCSEKSIFQFRKEEASAEGFRTPSTTKVRKNININSRDIKYDNNVRQAIRNIIYDLKYKNILPSPNTILKQIAANPHLPNFSIMTLRRLIFDMGFAYEKNGKKAVLVEKTEEPKAKDARKAKAKPAKKPEIKHSPQPASQPMQPPPPPFQENHRLLPMHVPQDNYMMPHNMPMMFNRMPPPPPMPAPNMNMPPWMHHTPHLMKSE